MRRWILSICLLLVLCGLILFGLCSWFLNSTAGSSWLLHTVANRADVLFTTGSLEGRLADELIIGELVIDWPGGQLTARSLRLNWQPFSLLQQKLNIHILEANQLVIRDINDSGEPKNSAVEANVSPFAARDLAFLPTWLTVQIDHLQLQDVSIRDDKETVLIANEISGSYLWSQREIKTSSFSYISPSVHLQGNFDWDLQLPHIEMTADVHLPDTLVDPELLNKITVPVDFPSQIAFDGDWNGFSGPIRFGHVTDIDNTVWLTAEAKGSWQGIRFENLQGRYLNGSLAGHLDLAWIDSYRMSGELTGSGLDPGALIEELNGRASFDISGELLVPYDERPLQAKMSAVIKEGQLRGHAIAGNLSAAWQDGGLSLLDLDLTGDSAKIVARGKPDERLDLDLAVDDLSPYYPDLAGQLTASGWLRWSDDYLTGEVHGSTANIVWQETSFASLDFNGKHLELKAPLALQLDGKGFRHGEWQAEHLQLNMSGILEHHDVQVTVTGLAGDLDLQLTGQYLDGVWQAGLQKLSVQTPKLGMWNLEAPAQIEWQKGGGSLSDFSMISRRDERVSLEISEWGSPTNSQLNLTWQDLGHDWLAYLQPSHKVSGRSTGTLQLEMSALRPVSLKARLRADAELQEDLTVVTVPVLTAEAVWEKDGLDLNIAAESDNGEHFEASVHSSQPPNWQWPPEQLSLDMLWQGLNLERISRFREGLEAKGRSDGHAQLEIHGGQLQRVSARVSAEGSMLQDSEKVGFRSLLAELNWDDKRFQCDAQIVGAHDGLLSLHLTSVDDPRFAWPKSGQVRFEIDSLKLQSLNPLLPVGMTLDGVLRAKSEGLWQEDGQFNLDGQVNFSDSELTLHRVGGQVDIQVPQADVEWQWQDEHLQGSLLVQLAKAGALRGNWQLPLPARWPIGFVADGSVKASLQGQLHATGMLAARASGLVQDLHGQIESDLQVTGTWQNPVFSGQMALLEAGAYLPATGVTINDFEVLTTLHGTRINIESFSLRSGSGTLMGSGVIDLDRWRLKHYQLVTKGDRLQVYNFPELQVLCSPELILDGDLENLKVNGSVLIPEMSLSGSETKPELLPSKDVIIAGEERSHRKTLPINADIRVTVKLGDQVRVKTSGVETRLQGGGTVTLNEQEHLAVHGEISLSEGTYKAYGANLAIKQGVLKYSGGPIENPSLNILALREVGTVQAGVQVTGTAEAPVVTLYSLPTMPERDIMGYIFMGRPMKAGQEGTDALMIGAGAMMPGYGGTFSDLGISEIDIQGLFSGTGGVSVRKRLTDKWEIESTLGIESGVDLYYLFKFD